MEPQEPRVIEESGSLFEAGAATTSRTLGAGAAQRFVS